MNIRKIRKEDDAVIESIIRRVMSEFDADPRTTIIGDPTLKTMYNNYQVHGAAYYIIEEDGIIAGGCGIKQLDNSTENICELQRMFLLPEFRGRGFGKLLIELCLRKAKDFGYEKIYLETLSQMKQAIKLYEKNGFVRTAHTLGNTGHSGCNTYMLRDV